MIEYRTDAAFTVEQMIELYVDSTLGPRRPVEDRDRMATMQANANLTITAWDGVALVGIARSVTDWVYATYLSDLAVKKSCQRQGIGKELIRRTQEAAPQAMLILLAAPAAREYYPHVGMEQHPSAWILRPGQKLKD
jgi:ribosomal protein S18 acetylase RimI-like enzyme